MKASGVDILIGAAFAGITSIVNGKAWANAMGGLPYQTNTCLQISLESRHISSEGRVLEV